MKVFLIKLIGAFLVVVASAETSRHYRAELRRKLTLARDAERFVSFVCESVSYHASPVSSILSSYETDIIELYDFYRRAAESSLSDELQHSPPPFDSTTLEILIDFSSRLGHGYTDSQLELCEVTVRRLREHISQFEYSVKNKEKASVATAVFIAASVVLILL